MKRSIRYLLLLLSLFFTNCFVNACNCNSGASLSDNVSSADVIVRVKIISQTYSDKLDTLNVEYIGHSHSIHLRYWKFKVVVYKAVVEETYKGYLKSDTISIVTGINGVHCGFKMNVDKEYIVYGFKQDYLGHSSIQRKATDHKLIWTNNCTRSWDYSESEAESIKSEVQSQMYERD